MDNVADAMLVATFPKTLAVSCPCGGIKNRAWTALNDAHMVACYKCTTCGHEHEELRYRYTEQGCPKHHWMFSNWKFKDSINKHSLAHLYLCDRCGKEHEERLDSGAVGLREAVDPENPKVKKLLHLDEHSARFHLTKEEITDFWEEK